MPTILNYYDKAKRKGEGSGVHKHLYMTLYLWKEKGSSEIRSGISISKRKVLPERERSGINPVEFENYGRVRLSFIEKFSKVPDSDVLARYIKDKFLKGFINKTPEAEDGLMNFLKNTLIAHAKNNLEGSITGDH